MMLPKKFLGENARLCLASKRGCVVKKICKPACECLFRNTSSIRAANQPRDFFCLSIGVYPSHPWLKNNLFAARMTPRPWNSLPVDEFFAMARMAIFVDTVIHCNYSYHYENGKHTGNAF
jgi:hypothetical protein